MKKIILSIFAITLMHLATYAQDAAQAPDSRGFVVNIGDMAPDFTIKFTDGTVSKKLSELKGSVVLLQFTASWCGVCIKEMPHIEKEIWEKYKEKGLQLFGVDRKESKEKVAKFAKKTKVTYPLILDENGEIFKLYANENAGVTRNILINKKGEIVFLTRLFVKSEFNELVGKIDKLLK